MKKLAKELNNLQIEVATNIEKLLETKGVPSRFTNSRLVLVIHDENMMFNLDSRRHLVEISEDELVDNEGYTYEHSVLELEDLCTAIDSVADGITPNFKLLTCNSDYDKAVRYFEDKQTAYAEFVKLQCKNEEVSLEEREVELDRHGMPQYKTINEHSID